MTTPRIDCWQDVEVGPRCETCDRRHALPPLPTPQEFHEHLIQLALEACARADDGFLKDMPRVLATKAALRERMSQAAQVYAILHDEITRGD